MKAHCDALANLTSLVAHRGLATLAVADLGGGSAAKVSHTLVTSLNQQGRHTLMVAITAKAAGKWALDDISAHTAITDQDGVDYLGAPRGEGLIRLESLVDALLRWQQEYSTVVVDAGSAFDQTGAVALTGCQGVLLVVDGGRDDEETLGRLLARLGHLGVTPVGILFNRDNLPRMGVELAGSLRRRLPAGWLGLRRVQQALGWLEESPFLNGRWC